MPAVPMARGALLMALALLQRGGLQGMVAGMGDANQIAIMTDTYRDHIANRISVVVSSANSIANSVRDRSSGLIVSRLPPSPLPPSPLPRSLLVPLSAPHIDTLRRMAVDPSLDSASGCMISVSPCMLMSPMLHDVSHVNLICSSLDQKSLLDIQSLGLAPLLSPLPPPRRPLLTEALLPLAARAQSLSMTSLE